MADQLSVQGSNDEPIDNEKARFEFNKEMFIEEVRKYRCLWDINSESYKNRPIKQNAWSKIAAVFNKDGKCLAQSITLTNSSYCWHCGVYLPL